MRSLTNQARANRGRETVEHYLTVHLEDFESEAEGSGSVAMVLADLRHFCDQHEIDFDVALTLSECHFEDELAGIDDYLDNEEEQ
jgi:hypothetical protein